MKNFDFQEKYFQISDPIESYSEYLLPVISMMVDVFLGVWKYLKKMTSKSFSCFLD